MRILQTSDSHIGVMAYSKVDPTTGLNARSLDFLNSFKHVVDITMKAKVDVFLVVGDLFSRVNPHPRYVLEVLRKFKELSRAGIHSIIISGNHETPRIATTLNPLTLLAEVEGVHVILNPTTLVVGDYDFVCIPAPPNFDEIRGLFEPMLQSALQNSRSTKRVLAAHIPVNQAVTSSEAALESFVGDAVDVSQIPTRFDYVALGHVHKFQQIQHDSMPVYYSGSTEKYEFGEEADQKFALLVELTDRAKVTPIELPTRKMVTLMNQDCTGLSAQQISQLILVAVDEAGGAITDAIVRIKLENIALDEYRMVDWNEIRRKLTEANVFDYKIQPRTAISRFEMVETAREYIFPPFKELELYIKGKKEYQDKWRLLLKLGNDVVREAREMMSTEA